MVGSGHPTALPTGRLPGVRVVIKWAYGPAVRQRRLRRERLEKVVSKVTATTTVRPFLAAITEFARTDFHRRVVWVAERIETNELYWRGTQHVCGGSIG